VTRRFLRAIQHRAARAAVGASATRGRGTSGVVPRARTFLLSLNLARFGTRDQRAFKRALDGTTARLKRSLPKRGASWGLARKLLNIFLRDSLYTAYLSKAYGLAAAERFLEIPLDSITALRIRQGVPDLPRWPGVKYVSPDMSAAYQAAALLVARQEGVNRVHLDAYWWGTRE
jgi:hypothetical protein